jgi:hypothetical protein
MRGLEPDAGDCCGVYIPFIVFSSVHPSLSIAVGARGALLLLSAIYLFCYVMDL